MVKNIPTAKNIYSSFHQEARLKKLSEIGHFSDVRHFRQTRLFIVSIL